jgi:hypothetical protein
MGRFSTGICHSVVFNGSHHLCRIAGGDVIMLGLGCGRRAWHCTWSSTVFPARAVPKLMPFHMVIETHQLTFPVALILITLVTFAALPAFAFVFSFAIPFGVAFGISFCDQ